MKHSVFSLILLVGACGQKATTTGTGTTPVQSGSLTLSGKVPAGGGYETVTASRLGARIVSTVKADGTFALVLPGGYRYGLTVEKGGKVAGSFAFNADKNGTKTLLLAVGAKQTPARHEGEEIASGDCDKDGAGDFRCSHDPNDAIDVDGDGKPNSEDDDDDNDGKADSDDRDLDGDGENDDRAFDHDGDGQRDWEDADIDGDGVENGEDDDINGDGDENGEDDDIDGDGIENRYDHDVDGDGVGNGEDPDIDGDGTLNDADTDRDGDGLMGSDDPVNEERPDGDPVEETPEETPNEHMPSATDLDGDGISNGDDTDIDGDGKLNGSCHHEQGYEQLLCTGDARDGDNDGDGIPNREDTDADGDGLTGDADTTPYGSLPG